MDDDKETLERFRVHEFLGRYVDALNHRDWVTYETLWIPDASFAMIYEAGATETSDKMTTLAKPVSIEVQGRDKILQMVSRYNNYPWLVQLPIGIVAELKGPNAAVARHTLTVNSQSLVIVGICYDRLIKGEDRVWRLVRRDFRPSYFENREAAGMATRTLPVTTYRDLP